MASSGTYTAFAPDFGDLFDEAFERCTIDPATVGARHIVSAVRSANLLMVDWSARKITHFDIDEQTQAFTQSSPTYNAPAGTILILEAVIRRSGRDTPVYPISREMYQRIPSKTQEGLPTSLWYDLAANAYTMWTTPENSTDVLRYRRLRRKQDVGVLSETPDAPYVYHDALCAGLAWKLSEKFAPHLYDALEKRHELALARAGLADREFVDVQFGIGN